MGGDAAGLKAAPDTAAINQGLTKLNASIDGFETTFKKRMKTVTGTEVQ